MDKVRRNILRMLGKGSVALAFLAQAGAALRAFVPNVLYEPLKRFKVRRPNAYPQGVTFDNNHRLFVVREDEAFHVISGVCTHLGCTVQWRGGEFDCPCHGSRFDAQGKVLGGPAPRPLPWYALARSPDGFLVVDTATIVASGYRFLVRKGKA
ncbi:MAG: ubiquinol-cytochrome c reductase iron-sulfur subunit [Candidatus Binatia bacterium]